jgi:AcrR family transcriptional regulator
MAAPSRKVNESWFNNLMARPRHITDQRLIEAAGTVIGRRGPGFTLADVAAEAKVAVGTVAQRFGNKHGLLVAMTRAAVDSMRGRMRKAEHGDAVGAVVHALVTAYGALDDPATAANNLAQLAVDLADDELRGLMAEFYSVMEAEVAALMKEAAGELPGAPPPERAARVLTALADGTAVHWSARPAGGLAERLRTDLYAVLDGWRTS